MRQRRPESPNNRGNNVNEAVAESNTGVNLDIGMIMLNAGVSFAKKYKKFSFAYLIGLVLLIFASGLAVSIEQQENYSNLMQKVSEDSTISRNIIFHRKKYEEYNEIYNKEHGFLNCNRVCEAARKNRNMEYQKIKHFEAQILEAESEAKSHLGVFSEHSVQEARNLFWETFSGGKDFAKRSSMFDLMFMGFDSMGRDEHIFAFLLRFMFQFIINFTLGVIGAFFGFIYYLGAVVNSYQPSLITGWLFYFLAILAAFSFVTTFLVLLYLSAAGTAFVAVKVGGAQMLQQGQRRRRVQYRRF